MATSISKDPKFRPGRGGVGWDPSVDLLPDPLFEERRKNLLAAAKARAAKERAKAVDKKRHPPYVVAPDASDANVQPSVVRLRARLQKVQADRDELQAALADVATQLRATSAAASAVDVADARRLNELLTFRLEGMQEEREELETTIRELGIQVQQSDADAGTMELMREQITRLQQELRGREAIIADMTAYLNRPAEPPVVVRDEEAERNQALLRNRVEELQTELRDRDETIRVLAMHVEAGARDAENIPPHVAQEIEALEGRLELVRAENDALMEGVVAEQQRQQQELGEAQQRWQAQFTQQATAFLQHIQQRDTQLAQLGNQYQALHLQRAQEYQQWQGLLNTAVTNQALLVQQLQQERQQHAAVIEQGVRYVQQLRNELETDTEEIRYQTTKAKQEKEELLGRLERAEAERELDAQNLVAERQLRQAEQQQLIQEGQTALQNLAGERDAVRTELEQLRQRIRQNERVEELERREYRERIRQASEARYTQRVTELQAEQAERQRQFDEWKQQKEAEANQLQTALTELQARLPRPGTGWGPAPRAKPRPKPAPTLLPETTTTAAVSSSAVLAAAPPAPSPQPATPALSPGAALLALDLPAGYEVPTGFTPQMTGLTPGLTPVPKRPAPSPPSGAPTPAGSVSPTGSVAGAVRDTARADERAQVAALLGKGKGGGGRGKPKAKAAAEVLPFGVVRPNEGQPIPLFARPEELRPIVPFTEPVPTLDERRDQRQKLRTNLEPRSRYVANGPRSWHTASSDDFHFMPVGENARISIPKNGLPEEGIPGWTRTPGSGLRGRPHQMVPPGWTVDADGNIVPPADATADVDPEGTATYHKYLRARQMPPEAAADDDDVVWYTVKGTKGGAAGRGRLTTNKALWEAVDIYQESTGNSDIPFKFYHFPGVRWIQDLENKYPGGLGMNEATAKAWQIRWNEKRRTFVKTREREQQSEKYTLRFRERLDAEAFMRDAMGALSDAASEAPAAAPEGTPAAMTPVEENDWELPSHSSSSSMSARSGGGAGPPPVTVAAAAIPVAAPAVVTPGVAAPVPQPSPTRVVRVVTPGAAATLLPELEAWGAGDGRVVHATGPDAHVPTGQTPPPALVVHRPTPTPAGEYTGGEVAVGSTAADLGPDTRGFRTRIFADVQHALEGAGVFGRPRQVRALHPARVLEEPMDETEEPPPPPRAREPMRLVDFASHHLASVGGISTTHGTVLDPDGSIRVVRLSPRSSLGMARYREALARATMEANLKHMQDLGIPPR